LVVGDGQEDAIVDGNGVREKGRSIPTRDGHVFGVAAQGRSRGFRIASFSVAGLK
jgi:hypothetical protein